MGCELNRAAKILFLIGSIFGVLAVIMYVIGHVGAAASLSVGFEFEGSTSGTVTVTAETNVNAGFSLNIKEIEGEANCRTHASGTVIKDPNGDDVNLNIGCSLLYRDPFLIDKDPPLMRMGTFYPSKDDTIYASTNLGTYTITAPTELWVVDIGEEQAEAVGGLLGGGIVIIVGVLFACIAPILCCVACCCMCTNASPQKTQGGGGTVIGQPAILHKEEVGP